MNFIFGEAGEVMKINFPSVCRRTPIIIKYSHTIPRQPEPVLYGDRRPRKGNFDRNERNKRTIKWLRISRLLRN